MPAERVMLLVSKRPAVASIIVKFYREDLSALLCSSWRSFVTAAKGAAATVATDPARKRQENLFHRTPPLENLTLYVSCENAIVGSRTQYKSIRVTIASFQTHLLWSRSYHPFIKVISEVRCQFLLTADKQHQAAAQYPEIENLCSPHISC